MGLNDDLVEKIYQWLKQREDCADKLDELANELESIRETCNAAECVGNTASVAGAACVIGAGVATLLTAGAAAPFLGMAGAAYTGVGVAVTLGTKLTEHFVSSGPKKEAEQINKKSNETVEEIQRLAKRLIEQIQKENPRANQDQRDQIFMFQIMKAIDKHYKVNCNFNSHDFDNIKNVEMRSSNSRTIGHIVATAGVLAFFAVKLNGKIHAIMFTEGAKQLVNNMSSAGFKTTLKGGAMVVGGAVGMHFALKAAIESWKKLIKSDHVTEASQSMRDTASNIRKMTKTLRHQLETIKKTLEEMARSQREKERKTFVRFFQACARTGRTAWSRNAPGLVNTRNSLLLLAVVVIAYLSPGWWRSDRQENDMEQSVSRAGPLRVGLLKVQPLSDWMSRVPEMVAKDHLDVFLTTGTQVRQDTAYQVLQDASPQNFSFYFQAERFGMDAITIQFSEQLQDDLLVCGTPTAFQCVMSELQRPEWKQPLLLITIRRAATTALIVFLTELQVLLDQVSECYESVLLSGDFQEQSSNCQQQSGNCRQQSDGVQEYGDSVQEQSNSIEEQRGGVQKQSGGTEKQSSDQMEDLLRTNQLVQHRGGVVYSRNVEISSVTIENVDSHQYITFSVMLQPRDNS